MNKVNDFRKMCEDAHGDNLSSGMTKRFISTGSYDVDRAYGGGLWVARFHLWVGRESVGKTTLAIHTMREVNLTNWDTGEYDPSMSNPTPVMFVDLEGTFDETWASKIGVRDFDDYNYVARPADGEIAANVVLAAIESGTFGLIIVDSNEAFVSRKTIEKAAEDAVMCDRAKILSRMYRVGQAHLNKAMNKEKPWQSPTVLCLNQLRDDLKSMHGGSTIPGGIAQKQYSTSIVQFNSPLVQDDSKKAYGIGEFKGVTKKNKGHAPKKNFTFEMAIRDLTTEDGDGLTAGQIDNAKSILSDVKDLNLLKKTDNGYEVMGKTFRVQADFKKALREDEKELRRVWQHLLEIHRK